MIYKKYIFKNSLLNWLSITFVFVILIWFSRAIAFLSFVTENGINLKDFLYLFLLILPWIMIYILPISFLVSSIISINKLSLNNEITILKSCSLSNFKIAKPIISLGIIISIISYFLSFYLMPLANKKLRISKNAIKENYANINFIPQTFENLNNVTIYSASRDENNNLRGLLISDQNNKEYNITITAESGSLIVNEDQVYLKLNNGTLQRFVYDRKKIDILNFDNYIFNLNNKNLENNKYKWKANERYISELLISDLNDSDEEIKIMRAEFHKRINEPLISLIFSLIVTSVIISAKISRKGNFLTILKLIFLSATYAIILIFSFRLNERHENLSFLPYFINLFLISFCLIVFKNK